MEVSIRPVVELTNHHPDMTAGHAAREDKEENAHPVALIEISEIFDSLRRRRQCCRVGYVVRLQQQLLSRMEEV